MSTATGTVPLADTSNDEAFIVGNHLTKAYGLTPKQAEHAVAQPDPAKAVAELKGYLGAHDVNFSIARGETFAIMGLSGSGKSTVLRMINRLNEPSLGELLIEGEDVTKVSGTRLREIRNRKTGMVFQHFSLFPHRTVRDNAAYGLKVRGVDKATRRELADEALHTVGLGDRGDRYPHELSGGMRQRVGLARALAVDPPILLMDEPFSALDPLIRRDMQDLLVKLQSEKARTTVFVTHDLNEAMRIGDKVMVMRQGRVVQLDRGPEIVANPADDYIREFVAEVDRSRVLTAGDLLEPTALTFSVWDRPADVLSAVSGSESAGAFVVGDNERLLGVAPLNRIREAVDRHDPDLKTVVTQEYFRVAPDVVVGDFMHLAGRYQVPITVADPSDRLLGVIPLSRILSSLSTVREEEHV